MWSPKGGYNVRLLCDKINYGDILPCNSIVLPAKEGYHVRVLCNQLSRVTM